MFKLSISSIGYSNNLMFFSFLMIILTIFGYGALAAEIGLVYSLISFINLIFSYNIKNLILFDNNLRFAEIVFIFRIILAVISLILFFLYKNLFSFSSDLIMFVVCVIIVQNWLVEIVLITNEVRKKNNFFNLYFIFYFLYYFLIILNIIFYKNYYFINILLLILLVNFYFIFLYKFNYKIKIKNFFKEKLINLKKNIFFSSFSVILSIIIWRIFIYCNFEKNISGILFSAFAIGSFTGTIFSNSIGPSLIKRKINFNKYLYVYFIFILFLIIFLINILKYKTFLHFILSPEQFFLVKCIIISLLGSPFILFAIKNRISFYNIEKYRNKIYFLDIITSIVISMIPIFLYKIDKSMVIYSYFFSSIIMSIFFSKLLIKWKI